MVVVFPFFPSHINLDKKIELNILYYQCIQFPEEPKKLSFNHFSFYKRFSVIALSPILA